MALDNNQAVAWASNIPNVFLSNDEIKFRQSLGPQQNVLCLAPSLFQRELLPLSAMPLEGRRSLSYGSFSLFLRLFLSSVVFLQILTRYGAELVFCTPTPTGRKETADRIAADTGGCICYSIRKNVVFPNFEMIF